MSDLLQHLNLKERLDTMQERQRLANVLLSIIAIAAVVIVALLAWRL
jgi:hypothetical protein